MDEAICINSCEVIAEQLYWCTLVAVYYSVIYMYTASVIYLVCTVITTVDGLYLFTYWQHL